MALIKNGQHTEDRWLTLLSGEALPLTGAVIIPLARWADLREEVLAHAGPLGLSLEPGDDLGAVLDDLGRFNLISISFPTFKDGRGFSTARLLRERYGFTGEVRATGHVIYDQLQFLHRCGFDAVDLPAHLAPQDWREALGEISVFYQPTGDGRQDVVRLRQGQSLPKASPQRYATAAE